MSIAKQLQRLLYLDQLIAKKNTGTPLELSQKIRVSERQVHNYLNTLKEMGAPIDYCYKRRTYYYIKTWDFEFKAFKDQN